MKKIIIVALTLVILALSLMAIRQNENIQTSYEKLGESSIETPTEYIIQKGIADSWKWISSTDASGKVISPEDSNAFVITFTDDGRLSSTTDCNAISGSYIKSEDAISIGPLATTLMACEGDTLESIYANQLTMASSHKIEGDTLLITFAKDAGTMTFIRN